MDNNREYAVVEYEDNSLGVVASAWTRSADVNNISSCEPPKSWSQKDYKSALEQNTLPDDSWPLHKCTRILCRTGKLFI